MADADQNSETPNWLKPDYNDDDDAAFPTREENEVGGGGEEEVTFEEEDVEKYNFMTEGGTASIGVVPESDAAMGGNNSKSKSSSKRNLCATACVILFSSILLALFLYAAVVQMNDPDAIVWASFYGLHATVPLLFLGLYTCFYRRARLSVAFVFLCLGMIVWSMAFVAVPSLELAELDDDEVGSKEKREELVFEVMGAVLGLFSAAYHSVLAYRRIRSS